MPATAYLQSLRASAIASRLIPEGLRERLHDALLTCLPTVLRRFWARYEQSLIIIPKGGGAATVIHSQGSERVELGGLDLQAPGSLQATFSGLKGGHPRTLIRLSSDQVLRRSVSLPVQVRSNLVQVLGYEMDRLSPFRSEEVYFDFRILANPAPSDKVMVDLALCRRDQVREWLTNLRDGGVPVDQVTWDGAWPKANLLPLLERPQRGTRPFSVNKVLLLAIFLLTVAVLVTPLWQMQHLLDDRIAEIAKLKVRAHEVHETRTALERARQGSVAVLQRKWEQPRTIDLLRELTERLPDDTWIQNLDYRDGKLQIRGESAQATALINLLDQAPGITAVAFRSPVVQVARSGRERFHIEFTYKRSEDP